MTTKPHPAVDSSPRERGAAVRFPLPPVLFAVPLVGALLVERWRPLPLGGGPVLTAAGVVITIGGVVFSLSGAATVVRHRTTLAPHRPVSALVTSGPFRVSRNPMYTGQAIALLGAALWAGSWWPVLADLLAVVLTRQLVIVPEEAYLTRRFAGEYEQYRSRVRRWL